MKKNLNSKRQLNFKSSISIALSFSLLAQPFLAQLAQAQTPSTAQSISYDTNGNMTKDENGNTYEYDAENRLISFVKGDGSLKTEYTYYADGLRKSKQITLKDKSASDPIVFYYDHAKNANVVNEVQGSGSSAVTSSYLMVGDTRYARYLSNDSSGAKYYVKNHKDTTMTVGANGASPISHSYTPYGVERKSTGTVATTADFSIALNPFLYSSQYTDAESGLQYLRARYYKADHMRFISRDTNSVPRNKYAYANGNPIMEDDPSGMMASWVKSFLSIGAGVVAGVAVDVLTGGAGLTGFGYFVGAAVSGAVGSSVESGVGAALGENSVADIGKNIGIGAALGFAGGAVGFGASQLVGLGERAAPTLEKWSGKFKQWSNEPRLEREAIEADKIEYAKNLKWRKERKAFLEGEKRDRNSIMTAANAENALTATSKPIPISTKSSAIFAEARVGKTVRFDENLKIKEYEIESGNRMSRIDGNPYLRKPKLPKSPKPDQKWQDLEEDDLGLEF